MATLFVVLALAAGIHAAEELANRPNVILFLIDDMGWTDLSCMGSTFYETPHIDRLAAEGLRFTHAYAACTVCSPTRAAVLTGRYPARLHITDWIAGHRRPYAKLKIPDWRQHLPLEEVTIAEALKSAGYATAHFGKWHLGGEGFEPDHQGFDVNFAGDYRGSPPSYFSPYRIPNVVDGPIGEYLTDRTTDELIKFIETNRDAPFFAYVPHYAVHTPIQAKPDVAERYRQKLPPDRRDAPPPQSRLDRNTRQENPEYAAMVEGVDQSVGRVMDALARLDLDDQTLIIFTGDNGGLTPVTSNLPARIGKGSPYEGGVRVPLIVRWRGVVPAGRTTDAPAISVDFLPTVLELCGVELPAAVDGESLAALWTGKQVGQPRALYWHYPHYHQGGSTPYGAIRDGDYRLVEFYETGRVELYDLAKDVGEWNDLATAMPDKAAELRAKLAAWRESVGAQMATANPDFDPARADESIHTPPTANGASQSAIGGNSK